MPRLGLAVVADALELEHLAPPHRCLKLPFPLCVVANIAARSHTIARLAVDSFVGRAVGRGEEHAVAAVVALWDTGNAVRAGDEHVEEILVVSSGVDGSKLPGATCRQRVVGGSTGTRAGWDGEKGEPRSEAA